MATFSVTTSTNTGLGSLRQAVTDANTNPGADTVLITAGGSVTLSTPLTISESLTIDGGSVGLNVDGSTVVDAAASLSIVNDVRLDDLTLQGTGGGAGALRAGVGLNGVSGTINLAGDTRINGEDGVLTLNAVTGNGFNLTLGGAGITNVNASISGVFNLTKDGTGNVTLSGANSHGGETLVAAGVLNLRSATALGTTAGGTTVSTGAALHIANDIAVGQEALTLNGDGILGGGALRSLFGDNVWGGDITLGSDALINADAGMLSLTGDVDGAGHDLSLGGAGTIVVYGSVGGVGSGLTKVGSGLATLAGGATYTGDTTIAGGTLALGTTLPTTTNVVIANVAGATLNTSGANQTIASLSGGGATGGRVSLGATTLTVDQAVDTAFAGVIAGTGGALVKAGSGELTLSGANTYTGATDVQAGVLQVLNATALGTSAGGTTVQDGASLHVAGTFTVNEALTLNGDGVGANGALHGGGGLSTWAGAITLGSDARISSSGGGLTLSGGISTAGHELTLSGTSNITISGVISGAGDVTSNAFGPVAFTAANTYTGATAFNGGSVTLGAVGALASGTDVSFAAAGARTVMFNGFNQSIGTLSGGGASTELNLGSATLTVSQDADTTFAGRLTGTGGLVKGGAEDLTLSGTNTYTGATTVTAGGLQVTGSVASAVTVQSGAVLGGTGVISGGVTVQSGGRLEAGASPGTLSTGNLTLNAGAVVEAEIDGASAGQFDVIDVTGTVSLGGATLDVQLGAFTPTAGASFVIIDNDGVDAVSGTFAGLAEGASFTAGGRTFVISYVGGDGNDVELTAAAGDTTPPTLSSAAVNGASLVMTWSETLDAGGPPAAGAFTVTAGGAPVAVTGVAVNALARTVTLTLAAPVAYGQAVTVAYADPSGGDDANAIQDQDGNDAASFGAAAVTNNTPDPNPPQPEPPATPTGGDDVLYLDETQTYLDAGAGDDFVIGGWANNTILGGEGADSLFGGAGQDVLEGGPGENYLRGGDGQDSLTGGADFDDLHGNIGDDTIRGGGGGDWVVGGQGQDMLFGGDGADVVLGNLGEDTLSGDAGNDVVRGGQGDDSVSGGSGDDWLAGDRGSDTLSGGLGADVFHTWGDAGLDVVVDFNAAEGDRVNLLAGTEYGLAQVGADVVISMTGGGQMVLQGVQLSSLPPGWIF